MSSIFAKIISGELPCHKVHESSDFIAFLDIMPLRRGHTLVIPKVEVDYLFDLDDDLLARMMIFSKEVAVKLKKSFACKRIGVTVIGLEVPHAHIHLIPIDQLDDMNFSKPKLILETEELAAIAHRISMA